MTVLNARSATLHSYSLYYAAWHARACCQPTILLTVRHRTSVGRCCRLIPPELGLSILLLVPAALCGLWQAPHPQRSQAHGGSAQGARCPDACTAADSPCTEWIHGTKCMALASQWWRARACAKPTSGTILHAHSTVLRCSSGWHQSPSDALHVMALCP